MSKSQSPSEVRSRPPTDPSLPNGWTTKLSRKGKLYFLNLSKKVYFRTLPEVLAYEKALTQQSKGASSPRSASVSVKTSPVAATCREGPMKPFSIHNTSKNSSKPKLPKTSAGSDRKEMLDLQNLRKRRCNENARFSGRRKIANSEAAHASSDRTCSANLPVVCRDINTVTPSLSKATADGTARTGELNLRAGQSNWPAGESKSRAGESSSRTSSEERSGGVKRVASKHSTTVCVSATSKPKRAKLPEHYRIPKRAVSAQSSVTLAAAEGSTAASAGEISRHASHERKRSACISPDKRLKRHDRDETPTLSTEKRVPTVSDCHLNLPKRKRRKEKKSVQWTPVDRERAAPHSQSSRHRLSAPVISAPTAPPAFSCPVYSELARESAVAPAALSCPVYSEPAGQTDREYPVSVSAPAVSESKESAGSDSQESRTVAEAPGHMSQEVHSGRASPDIVLQPEDALMEWESEVCHSSEEVVNRVADWRSSAGAEVSFSEDSCSSSAAPPHSSSHQWPHLVIDTNVLIKSVDFVSELRHCVLEGAPPVLMIPWIVFQELDKLKTSTRHLQDDPVTNSSKTDHQGADSVCTVGAAARRAVSFLLSCLQAANPHVRGQTVDEARAADGVFASRLPDDAVLKCCLWLKGRCLLITEDKNLSAKALVHRVHALSCSQLVSRFSLCDIREPLPMTDESCAGHAVRLILRCLLSHVVVCEMSQYHGSDWGVCELLASSWPPALWSSCILASVVRRLGRTVFRRLLASDRRLWMELFSKTAEVVWSSDTLSSVLSLLCSLLSRLQASGQYQPVVEPLLSVVLRQQPLSLQAVAALLPSVGRLVQLSPDGARRQRHLAADYIGDLNARKLSECRSQSSSDPSSALCPACSPTLSFDLSSADARPSPALSPASSPTPSSDQVMVDHVQEEQGQCLLMFQQLWNYLHTCCGVLLDAASLPHDRQYSPPSPFPSLAECREFAPRVSVLVSTLLKSLHRLMEVSVVSIDGNSPVLLHTLAALNDVFSLSGQPQIISESLLIDFIKKPSNRLLLGEAIKQLKSIEAEISRANAALNFLSS